jgi:phage host-nuclease inhibitor protein Gam
MQIPYQAISNDIDAEELIVKILDAEAEKNRLVDICKAELAKQTEKYTNKIAEYEQSHIDDVKYAKIMLGEYCRLKASRTTKTLTTHKLPSGTLKWVKRAPSVVRDDSKLIAWLKTNIPSLIRVQTTEKPAWDELKKIATEATDHYEYVTADGELINVDGVTLVAREDEFVIE